MAPDFMKGLWKVEVVQDMYNALLTLTNLLEIHKPEWYTQAHSELAMTALIKAREGC